jgi:large subunit ribosomal protein L10
MSSRATYVCEPSAAKKQQLNELADLLGKYETIGITKIENIASKTIQRIRHNLRGEAIIKVAKNTLMLLAIKEAAKKNKSLKKLSDYINGSCAFLLTNSNPFKIANYLEKNKVPTPAKEGQVAPKEVKISARDTGFDPGPVIGELQSIGLKTRIEGGTIKIIEDSVVCKEGEKVSYTLSNVLNRLGIEPFDSGLSIDAVISEGSLITHDALIVDTEEILDQLKTAYKHAYSLSVEAVYPTKDNLSYLIGKVRREALNLALESNFITPETAKTILSKSQLQAIILAKSIAEKDASALPEEVLSQLEGTTTTSSSQQKTTDDTSKEEAETTEDETEEEEEEAGSLFG